MELEFVPKCAQGDEKTYEGSCKFRTMTVDEKYEFAEQLQAKSESHGKMKALQMGLDAVSKFVVSMSFKNLETGVQMSCFEDVRLDSRNDELIQELVAFVIHGFKVPKNLKA